MSDNAQAIQAQRDLDAIKTLQANEAFNGYYMRRFNQRLAEITEHFNNDPPEKCTYHQREAYRQIKKMLEEIRDQMKVDEINCKHVLTQEGKRF